MIYCKDCEFDYIGYCSRLLKKHEFTGEIDITSLKSKDINDKGDCTSFKPIKKKKGG